MVKFSKFNGLGNDFIITDENIEQEQINSAIDILELEQTE